LDYAGGQHSSNCGFFFVNADGFDDPEVGERLDANIADAIDQAAVSNIQDPGIELSLHRAS